MRIGDRAGSDGEVLLSGAGTRAEAASGVWVGLVGSGALEISDGAALESGQGVVGSDPGSVGTALVTGAGSSWTASGLMQVGRASTGALTISDGGSVTSSGISSIATATDAMGTVLVEGAGSSWVNDGELRVGDGIDSVGELVVTGGATVESDGGTLGRVNRSSGSVTVTGSGSSWVNTGDLVLGSIGSGELTVADGAVVEAASLTAGAHPSSFNGRGVINIGDGAGAGILSIADGRLQTGNGQGTLTFNHSDADHHFTSDGGAGGDAIDITGAFTVRHTGTGQTVLTGDNSYTGATQVHQGTLIFRSSALQSSHLDLIVGENAGDDGALVFDQGTQATARNVVIGEHADADGRLTVSGAGSALTATAANPNGNLTVGAAGEGALTILDGATATSRQIRVGLEAGSSGEVTVSGAGSELTSTGTFTLGNLGQASLRIEDGGLVSSGITQLASGEGSVAEVTVSGAGSRWTPTQPMTVGLRGSASITVEDGGVVESGAVTIGSNFATGEGEVAVRGADSRWTSSSSITVGFLTSGALHVEDGGTVQSATAAVGSGANGSGQAVVSGAGSSWTSDSFLTIGQSGGEGSLTVADGGRVHSVNNADVGLALNSTGEALVTGAGSELSTDANLRIGWRGDGSLTVTDGGQVTNVQATLGEMAEGVGEARVEGAGSVWTSTDRLTVGLSGQGSLTVADGGLVAADTMRVAVGGSSSGIVNIGDGRGAGILAIDSGAITLGTNGVLAFNHTETEHYFTSDGTSAGDAISLSGNGAVRHEGPGSTVLTGTYAHVGGTVAHQGELIFEGADIGHASSPLIAGASDGDDGTIVLRGGTEAEVRNVKIGVDEGARGAVVVTGAGTELISLGTNPNGTITAGIAGEGSLTISDGASATVRRTIIGDHAGASGLVTVTGVGSSLSVQDTLLIGREGEGELLIENGGLVVNAVGINGGIIGDQAGSSGLATVRGAGSQWNQSGHLLIGQHGEGELRIEDGGSVLNQDGRIGTTPGGSGSVLVTGTGSEWVNEGFLGIGFTGQGELTVADGGRVVSRNIARIGQAAGAAGEATVTGAGSEWIVENSLTIGGRGQGDLTIAAGGLVESESAMIGEADDGSGAVLVTGAGSKWVNAGLLRVGSSAAGTLEIADGGSVSGERTSIGSFGTGAGEVIVDGVDSEWALSGELTIGDGGEGSLDVINGGLVSSADAILGFGPNGDGSAAIDGAGSRLAVSGDLTVGRWGPGALTVSDGGAVAADNAAIGLFRQSDSQVTIIGAGSELRVADMLSVGTDGTGGLLLADGGVAVSAQAIIGEAADGNGHVQVTGPDSLWTVDDLLTLGLEGAGALTIEDGGLAETEQAAVGSGIGGEGSAVVSGHGSLWQVRDLLSVGIEGEGLLTVENQGSVAADRVVVGADAGGAGTVRITGGGSQLAVSDTLHIGGEGSGSLTLADGGSVSIHGGTGDVVIAAQAGGSGALNIGAAAGDGAAAPGAVHGGIVFGPGQGELVFNHDAEAHVFANAISGGLEGQVRILAGHTVFVGDNAFTGATVVEGGRLSVGDSDGHGSLDGSVEVRDGGRLGGAGRIGGEVSVLDGGILSPGSSVGTLQVGALTLQSGSVLEYRLDGPGVAGSGVNDLIIVDTDLTLDGVLNVTDQGGFAPGVYTLMTYGGDLTDNGLTFGELPDGVAESDLIVQTSRAGEINLLSSAGLTLEFWDGGDVDRHGDGVIDGGNGVWDGDSPHWTTPEGGVNGRWGGGFAIFQGDPGLVEVQGNVDFAGLQIRSDGYAIESGTGGVLNMTADETVIRVDQGVTGHVAATIAGHGALVKSDHGTLILSGDNTFEGGVMLRAGVLEISADQNLGATSGALSFEGGALRLGDDWDSARSIVLDADALIDTAGHDASLAGDMHGPGALILDGGGSLRLSGANDFGGAEVRAGALIGDSASLSGDVSVAEGARLVFDQSGQGMFGGRIDGDGLAMMSGEGTLTLTGRSTADWHVTSGLLAVAPEDFLGDADVSAGAVIVFDQGFDGDYAGSLTGEGSLIKRGGGLISFTGNSDLSSALIEQGGLSITGAFAGDIEVGSEGWLGGTGDIGGNVIVAGGLAPGASIGTLTVDGDVTFLEGSLFEIEIDAAGRSDLLVVGGQVVIEGGTMVVLTEDAAEQFQPFVEYTIITADGGVSGEFSDLQSPFPFLQAMFGGEGGALTLTLARSDVDFADAAVTANQISVARALDSVIDPSDPGGFAGLFEGLMMDTEEQARRRFDLLSGESHASLQAAIGRQAHDFQRMALSQRLAERRGLADEAGDEPRQRRSVWASGYGLWSDADGDGNARGFQTSGGGAMVGIDADLAPGFVGGIAAQAVGSRNFTFDNADRASVDGWGLHAYAGAQLPAGIHADASVGWTRHQVSMARTVLAEQVLTAQSSYQIDQFTINAELGRSLPVAEGVAIRPHAGLSYACTDREAFTESGAGAIGLTVASARNSVLEALAGAEISGRFQAAGGAMFTPAASLGFVHAFDGAGRFIDAGFIGADQTRFSIAGVDAGRDRIQAGVSAGLDLPGGAQLEAAYQTRFASGETVHRATAGLRVGF